MAGNAGSPLALASVPHSAPGGIAPFAADDLLGVYYCATPPAAFSTIVRQLEVAGMARASEPGQRRVIIEKPFGTGLASARELNALVSRVFGEESVYRIDHYLGKETVQNIVAFRFANSIFEPLWSNRYVDNV